MKCLRLKFWSFLIVPTGLLAATPPALSQIVPDATLGAESSRTVPTVINGSPAQQIEGGALRGFNLFHSFQEFSIGTGQAAYFTNPAGVQTILTRVTGSNPSAIFGTLGVLGNANLLLINPKGIVFGSNARLDLRGSFLASTADSFVLSNGVEFSATNPQAPSLLTVSIPVGLRFRDTPAAIVNQSQSLPNLPVNNQPGGLQVDPGQTLALVGGDISLNNGNLTALQGTVLLGSVASSGVVGFVPTPTGLTLDYTGISRFGTIDLNGNSSVTVSGLGGGAIQVRGGTVRLRDRANLVSDTFGSLDGREIAIQASQFTLQDKAYVAATTFGTGAGSNLLIQADSIEINGSGFLDFQQRFIIPVVTGQVPNFDDRTSSLSTGTVSAGKAGDITLNVRQLSIGQGGAILSPALLGTGNGGNITINATGLVDVSAAGILTTTFSQGNAGTLSIDTARVVFRDESTIATSTFSAGNSGDITIRASDSVVLVEGQEFSPFGTNLATSTIGGSGNAGNIDITTRSLLLDAGATITSASGATATSTIIRSSGRGGNITINATDSVTVRGTSSPALSPSRSQIATATLGAASAGDLNITTRRLVIQNGGSIGASTLDAGNGGNVTVRASDSIEVSGIGISADGPVSSSIETASGDPKFEKLYNQPPATGVAGNIYVQSPVIRLRQSGRISTDARIANGGNITIDADILLAFPQENSDITANTRTARGGRVTVNVPNIFGMAAITREEIRDRLGLTDAQLAALPESPTFRLSSNDISAISQVAGPDLQGNVVFSTAGINPAQNLVELPETIVDPNALIATNPCTQLATSEFVITGRGGLPPSPNDSLSDQSPQYTWIEPIEERGSKGSGAGEQLGQSAGRQQPVATLPLSQSAAPLQAAQGWVMTPTGEVTLTASSTIDTAQRAVRSSALCSSH